MRWHIQCNATEALPLVQTETYHSPRKEIRMTSANPQVAPAICTPSTEPVPNYYITDHFLYSDFICPCCDSLKVVPGVYRHAVLLERMRKELGFPIVVTSGYRYPDHNTHVNGSTRSWHLLFATDIRPQDHDPKKLRLMHEAVIRLGFGGIGVYDAHIHVDLRPEPLM